MAYFYSIPVGETIKQAWEKVSGSKRVIWEALGISVLILLFCVLIQQLLMALIPRINVVTGIIIQLIAFLLQVGLLYIGIKRAQDLPINYRLVFHCFNILTTIKLIVLFILQSIILAIPTFLLVSIYVFEAYKTLFVLLFLLMLIVGFILFIYLFIRMMLAIGFVIDQEKNPWEAIVLSFKATQGNALNLIAIWIIQSLIFILGFITFGIGFIWIIPFSVIIYGMIYKNLQANLNVGAVTPAPPVPQPPPTS